MKVQLIFRKQKVRIFIELIYIFSLPYNTQKRDNTYFSQDKYNDKTATKTCKRYSNGYCR